MPRSTARGATRLSALACACSAVAYVALHTGAKSLNETAAFYEREAGMPVSAARSEAIKNSMFPGAAMMYLVGTDAIHDLRRQIAERDGSAFAWRDFHDSVLHYGAIPVALIAHEMFNGG